MGQVMVHLFCSKYSACIFILLKINKNDYVFLYTHLYTKLNKGNYTLQMFQMKVNFRFV